MADEDEHLSHLRAPDAADDDPEEETHDYRALDKLAYGHDDFPIHVFNCTLTRSTQLSRCLLPLPAEARREGL
jgi:hypothetical protein